MRVWFITGASRGFGAKIAAEALAQGDAVVATARDPSAVEKQLGHHKLLVATELDVTNETQAIEAASKAIDAFGRIDILVNNAGYGLLGGIEEASAEEIQRVYATNVFGLLNVTRAVLPHMRKVRSGHIMNMSSVGGYVGYPGWGIYGSTKFAVEGISEALNAEVAPLGIHVTVVEPGFFRTDFLDDQSVVRTAREISDYAETVGNTRSHAASVSHKQPGDPQKLAKAFMQLATAKTPPSRLQLGSDTVARIEAKERARRKGDERVACARDVHRFRTGGGVMTSMTQGWIFIQPIWLAVKAKLRESGIGCSTKRCGRRGDPLY